MSMSRSSFEAEDGQSSLRRPLLSDAEVLADDDDDGIVSQLMSADERHGGRRRCRRRRCPKIDKVPLCAFGFVVVAWMGLFASVWSTFSCDLAAVHYPAGGLELSVTGIGVWSYQREHRDPKQSNGSGGDGKQATKHECVDYSEKQPNPAVNMTGFFPSDKTLQIYSIVAPSFYFAAVLAMFAFLLMLAMHPEVLARAETEQYPATGLRATMAVGVISLVTAGIFHLLTLHGLLHFSSEKSPLCNPEYSHCDLGTGGRWAAYAIFSSFFCGSVSCLVGYSIGCRRSTRC